MTKLSGKSIISIIDKAKSLNNPHNALKLLLTIPEHNKSQFSTLVPLKVAKHNPLLSTKSINKLCSWILNQITINAKRKKNDLKISSSKILSVMEKPVKDNLNNAHMIDNIYALSSADKAMSYNTLARMPFATTVGTIPYHPDESVDLNMDYLSLVFALIDKYHCTKNVENNSIIMDNLILSFHYIMNHTHLFRNQVWKLVSSNADYAKRVDSSENNA